jgi:hypothetical protein
MRTITRSYRIRSYPNGAQRRLRGAVKYLLYFLVSADVFGYAAARNRSDSRARDSITRVRGMEYERRHYDETSCRSVAAF